MSRSSRGRGGKKPRDDGWGNWGGYMNAKRQKLQDQFSEEAPQQMRKEGSSSRIFSGITIHVNGYTKPSSDELKRMMMLHGGNYEHYLRRTRVSHVIATNLPDSKIREIRGLKVVKPEWITDSIAAGKLLSYTDYQLYTAQTGRQLGLKGFTVRQEGNQIDQTQMVDQSMDDDFCDVIQKLSSSHKKNKKSTEIPNMAYDLSNSSESPEKHNDPNSSSSHRHSDMQVNLNKTDVIRNKNSDLNSTSLQSNKYNTNKDNTNKENHSPAKAGDPKFLNEYYTNSRLHHLSTWKAEFKNYINELQAKGADFTGRDKLRALVQSEGTSTGNTSGSGKRKRCVMHVDMDCFFVSVGLRKRPDLKGKPVAVTHSKGKGATINPEADFNFEKQRFKQTRQEKKKETATNGSFAEMDLSFPDESDSEDEEVDPKMSLSKPQTDPGAVESFHSMAEIASCSYEARQAGVRNGMFMGTAKKLCPGLVTIPYDFEGYKSVSRSMYDIVASYTHDIEAVSCDEMLVDCTDLLSDTGATPDMFATQLRQEIFNKTGCSASAGFASNILLAKMATRKAKPNGQYHLMEAEVIEFIRNQSVRDIPGVGWSLTKRLDKMGITTCGDLQKQSIDSLQKEFGVKTGQSLYKYCRGQDDRPIRIEQQRKSVSAEVNYGIRFTTAAESIKFVEELAEEVCTRLKNLGMKGKTVTLKLMVRREEAPKETSKFMGHGICNNFSKSTTLPLATNELAIIKRECIGILKQNKASPQDLRGIGIQIQRLEPEEVGLAAAKAKGQSILNFIVDKSASHKPSHSENKQSNDNSKLRQESLNSSYVTEQSNDAEDKFEDRLFKSKRDRLSIQSDSVVIDSAEHKPESLRGEQKASTSDSSYDVSSGQISINMLDHVEQERPASPVNLVEDIAWRQVSPNKLPPLPSLPQLSPRLSQTRVRTPEPSTSGGAATVEIESDDYFPSPSQVDPEVLNELPAEIRIQIEEELQSRKKAQTERRLRRDRGNNSTQETKGVNSRTPSHDSERSHDNDAITALPSPSQIDPSCLSALPESMQRELQEAYARQNNQQRAGMLNLKQAKSPSKSPTKSPSKKSPAKKSPQFKVPRGQPSKRGRKKGTSKKLLFSDSSKKNNQGNKTAEITRQQNAHSEFSNSVHIHSNTSSTITIDDDRQESVYSANVTRTVNRDQTCYQSTSTGVNNEDQSSVNKSKHHNASTSSCSTTDIDNQTSTCGMVDCDSVNLCGAVDVYSVRSLLQEWISSTPEPQSIDEKILIDYLQDLIEDKNLELVDLVLKFMQRRINKQESQAWKESLQKIFYSTQYVVKTMYGSQLFSLKL